MIEPPSAPVAGACPPPLPAVPVDVPVRLELQSLERIRQLGAATLRVVHERDDFTCRCCGWRSRKYQEAVISGADWRDLHAITTACIFCHQCFHLEAAVPMRSAVMIGFSGLSQAALNRLMVDIYMARITIGKGEQARRCLDALLGLRKVAVDLLGTDDPLDVALMLRQGDHEDGNAPLRQRLQGIRLLPLDRRIVTQEDGIQYNAFPQILADWRATSGMLAGGQATVLQRLDDFAQRFL